MTKSCCTQVHDEGQWPSSLVQSSDREPSMTTDDWELVPQPPDPTSKCEQPITNHHVEVDDLVYVMDGPSDTLKYTPSSPEMCSYGTWDYASADGAEDPPQDDSFSFISSPPSVVSVGGSSTRSYRDVILENCNEADVSWENMLARTTTPPPTTTTRRVPLPTPRPTNGTTTTTRPKLVVTPIQKCLKRAGNPQSLARISEDHDDDDDGFGATDEMDYYSRKSLGAKSYHNGLRLRPDEAQRKQMILNKKADQRRMLR